MSLFGFRKVPKLFNFVDVMDKTCICILGDGEI